MLGMAASKLIRMVAQSILKQAVLIIVEIKQHSTCQGAKANEVDNRQILVQQEVMIHIRILIKALKATTISRTS